MTLLLRCHPGIGPPVIGIALVAADNFSARYDLDRSRGIFSRPAHKLAGESYVDQILVLDNAKGGVATAWMLHEMMARTIVPRGLIFNRVNPILAQGAAFANLALVDRFDDGDVTRLFRTGDEVAPRSRRRRGRDFEPGTLIATRLNPAGRTPLRAGTGRAPVGSRARPRGADRSRRRRRRSAAGATGAWSALRCARRGLPPARSR